MDTKTKAPESSGAFLDIFWRVPVPAEWAGQSLNRFLREALALGQRYIAHLKFRPGGLLLDGAPVQTDRLLRGGEELCLAIGDGAGNPAPPVQAPFDLVWEDEFLAVLNKAPGIAVHGASGEALPPTLQNAAAFHWGAAVPFHPVQRLDRGTSGLMLLAKCRLAHQLLQRRLHSEALTRDYLALVHPAPAETKARLSFPIAPAGSSDHRRIVRADGQAARTDYELLAAGGEGALLRLRLQSGRCHQIRVHCAAAGFPLLGDRLYGGAAVPGLTRPALHSWKLGFCHPFTGENLCFTAPLPADLRILCPRL